MIYGDSLMQSQPTMHIKQNRLKDLLLALVTCKLDNVQVVPD